MIKIKAVQENPKVGDIKGNTALIEKYLVSADKEKIDLLIFSEMFLSGYPPEDLVMRDDFLDEITKSIEHITSLSKETSLVFGAPIKKDGVLYNAAICISEGNLVETYFKQILPNYKEFDEKRYFEKGKKNKIIKIKNISIGLSICEDIWSEAFVNNLVDEGAEIILNLSASPYTTSKKETRKKMLSSYYEKYQLPIVYVNQTGGQDELVFDGSSLILGSSEKNLVELKSFEIDSLNFEYRDSKFNFLNSCLTNDQNYLKDVYDALVLGTKDYVEKNNFKGVLIGSSGGIDSALTAAIAFDALGKGRVKTIMMPFDFTADISIEDAGSLAKNLGIEHSEISIKEMYESFSLALKESFEGMGIDKTEENLQSRCRGVTLMALSNKLGFLVLTTGNKSEAAVGYSTLYGDTAGGFSVLKDVSKTLVYELANYRNSLSVVIPKRIIERPPSAELAPDQKDTDSLPDYDRLDPIIEMYVEDDKSIQEIINEGFDEKEVRRIVSLIDFNEYKRRQAPLGIKISDRNFGKDRRYPITNSWKP